MPWPGSGWRPWPLPPSGPLLEFSHSTRIRSLDTERILAVLEARGVDYVLIGGIACLMHGASRVTVDADVIAAASIENATRLIAALGDLGAAVLMSEQRMKVEDGEPWEVESLRRGPDGLFDAEAWHFTTDAGPLDVIFHAAGVGDYHEHLHRAERLAVFGIEVKVAGIDDLIRSKESLSRSKDLSVLDELRQLRDARGSP